MRVALVSRYPRVDSPAWKRVLADRLLLRGIDVGVVYSRSTLIDHASAGFREFGFGLVGRFLHYTDRERTADAHGAGTLARWAQERELPSYHGRRLGDAGSLAWLRSFAPDLMILVGADIVPSSLLEVPRLGTINPHYGLLPRYRGMNVTEWSIYHDDPVGVSIHMVDPGIDTGDILFREALPVAAGATLTSIRAEQQQASARLLEQAATMILDGYVASTPQPTEGGRQFYRMHPVLRERVERRLADATYRWLGVAHPPLDVQSTAAAALR